LLFSSVASFNYSHQFIFFEIMKGSDFTVLLPTHDRQDMFLLFDRAINSCLDNTILPNQILVVVDGPVHQEFSEKIKKYESHELISILWLKSNVGLARALNEGLKLIDTKYVFRADGDDFNRKNRFQVQLEMLDNGYDLVGSAIAEKDMDGKQLAVKRCPLKHSDIISYAYRRCPINHMTAAYRTDLVKSVGGYPEIYLKEDWALWTLMIEAGAKISNSDEILVDALTDINMYKRRGGFKNIISELSMQKFLVKHLSKSIFMALTDFILKSLIMAAPSFIREKFYLKYLRNKK
jgi:glycosyltransferase involved in cell wall biosynthesis